MKKLLMLSALLVVGVTSFAEEASPQAKSTMTTPVNVSIDVVQTSQLVLMDGSKQLTSIELKHPQILLSSAKTTNTPSVVRQNFKVQTGDGSPIKVNSKDATTLGYTLEGIEDNTLTLKSGTNTLASTLSLANTTDTITGGVAEGFENTITSTIDPKELNKLTTEGTYSGAATLKVTVQ